MDPNNIEKETERKRPGRDTQGYVNDSVSTANETSEDAQKSPVAHHSPDPREYPTALAGRYAGDGIRAPTKGGAMVLRPCDWCGKLCNFRRAGHRICPECWQNRDVGRVNEGGV